MKRRLLIGLALLGVASAAFLLLIRHDTENGFYQGRSVEHWARLAAAGNGDAETAIRAMGTNAVPELIRLLQVHDTFLRRQVWALARRNSLPLRLWFPGLKPPDAAVVRAGAIRSLGVLGPDARMAAPALGKIMRGSDHQERADASAALGRIGKDSLPVLLAALEDHNADVRRAAASALAQLGPDAQGAVPALARLLLDPDRSVRDVAAYALQTIGAPAAGMLGNAIEQGDERARGAAVQSLLLIARSLRQAEPALVKMAQSDNATSRQQAIQALGVIHIPDNPTIKTLTNALSDPALEVRLAAANALANVSIRGQAAVPALIVCLEDSSPELRQAAARTLGLIGVPANAALPKLQALMEDTNNSVRVEAKEALGRIAP